MKNNTCFDPLCKLHHPAMSTTPRTDRTAELQVPGLKHMVQADFARQLERELAGFCTELGCQPSETVLAMIRLQEMKRALTKEEPK